MLYLYLQQLKENHEEDKVLDSVSELKSITKRMNEMLIAVGKNVITDNSFDEVIQNQNKLIIDFFIDQFITNITFLNAYDISEHQASEVTKVFFDTIFNDEKLAKIFSSKRWEEKWEDINRLELEFKQKLLKLDERLIIENFDRWKIIGNFHQKVIPILKNNPNLWNYLEEKLSKEIEIKIIDLPF